MLSRSILFNLLFNSRSSCFLFYFSLQLYPVPSFRVYQQIKVYQIFGIPIVFIGSHHKYYRFWQVTTSLLIESFCSIPRKHNLIKKILIQFQIFKQTWFLNNLIIKPVFNSGQIYLCQLPNFLVQVYKKAVLVSISVAKAAACFYFYLFPVFKG